jgi:large subunit ribosomal protein L10
MESKVRWRRKDNMTGKKKTEKKVEQREASDEKKKIVADLASKMKKNKTVLLASTKGLPSSQFHQIKKNFRGKAEIKVVKKSAALRAIETAMRPGLDALKNEIRADVAIFFSDLDAFELSGMLTDNQSPTKAKAGDIAPEDIIVEAGPTELLPGPAISELSGVGLRVAVEGGKIAVKMQKVIVAKGEVVKENVASVLGKLNITPMKVGFEPLAAYDSVSEKVYVGIKIDKAGALEQLRHDIGKALGFATKVGYVVKETLSFFMARANAESKAIENLINKSNAGQPASNNQ